jgi:hypothetical protein
MNGNTAKRWVVTWTVRSCLGIEDEGAKRFDDEFDADWFAQEKTEDIRAKSPVSAFQVWVREVA